MTEMQNIMLSVCFGAVCGFYIATLLNIIQFAVGAIRKKISKYKEAKRTAEQAE